MSHFTSIKTQIRDIKALQSACRELGLTMTENAKAALPQPERSAATLTPGPSPKGRGETERISKNARIYGLTTDWYYGHVEREATKFLEEALGTVADKRKKPEFHRRNQRQQRIGG